jgi:hypothetical protein
MPALAAIGAMAAGILSRSFIFAKPCRFAAP